MGTVSRFLLPAESPFATASDVLFDAALRIVDTKAILYLEAPTTSEALTWFRAINMHVPAQRPEAE